MGKEQLPKFKD